MLAVACLTHRSLSLFLLWGAQVFHPGVCSGLAKGEDPNAWDKYYHAAGPLGKPAKDGTSCANGSYLNGTCDSGKTRTASVYVNASLRATPGGGPKSDGTPDSMVAQFAIETIARLGAEARQAETDADAQAGATPPFFLAVGLHKPHLPHVAPGACAPWLHSRAPAGHSYIAARRLPAAHLLFTAAAPDPRLERGRGGCGHSPSCGRVWLH